MDGEFVQIYARGVCTTGGKRGLYRRGGVDRPTKVVQCAVSHCGVNAWRDLSARIRSSRVLPMLDARRDLLLAQQEVMMTRGMAYHALSSLRKNCFAAT